MFDEEREVGTEGAGLEEACFHVDLEACADVFGDGGSGGGGEGEDAFGVDLRAGWSGSSSSGDEGRTSLANRATLR